MFSLRDGEMHPQPGGYDRAAAAQAEHLEKTLERHAVAPPTDLNTRRLFNETTAKLRELRSLQSECVEYGQVKAGSEVQDAVEALERARRAINHD